MDASRLAIKRAASIVGGLLEFACAARFLAQHEVALGIGKAHGVLLPGFRAAEARVRKQRNGTERFKHLGGLMKGVSECTVLTIALAVLAQPLLARTYLIA
jgi:hypothetical protein